MNHVIPRKRRGSNYPGWHRILEESDPFQYFSTCTLLSAIGEFRWRTTSTFTIERM